MRAYTTKFFFDVGLYMRGAYYTSIHLGLDSRGTHHRHRAHVFFWSRDFSPSSLFFPCANFRVQIFLRKFSCANFAAQIFPYKFFRANVPRENFPAQIFPAQIIPRLCICNSVLSHMIVVYIYSRGTHH